MKPYESSKYSIFIIGLFTIAVGVLLIAFDLGMLPESYKFIIFSWQALCITLGIALLFARHKRIFGLVLILVGSYFILPKLDVEVLFLRQGWATFFIITGIFILCHVFFGRRPHHHTTAHYHTYRHFEKKYGMPHIEKENEETWKDASGYKDRFDYIDVDCIFGGCNEKVISQNFKGGILNCLFGSVEVDLTNAQLAEGINTLEINAIFGGIILYVPAYWKIDLRQTRIFGHFEDNRPLTTFEIDEKRLLVIVSSSIFGGGEIKNK